MNQALLNKCFAIELISFVKVLKNLWWWNKELRKGLFSQKSRYSLLIFNTAFTSY